MSKIQDYYDFIDKFQGNLNESQKGGACESWKTNSFAKMYCQHCATISNRLYASCAGSLSLLWNIIQAIQSLFAFLVSATSAILVKRHC